LPALSVASIKEKLSRRNETTSKIESDLYEIFSTSKKVSREKPFGTEPQTNVRELYVVMTSRAVTTATTNDEKTVAVSNDDNCDGAESSSMITSIPFAVKLPTSTLKGWDEPTPVHGDDAVVAMMGENGIVGSIIIMGKKSAMIWVGWGQLDLIASSSGATAAGGSSTFGSGAPTMGQLVVSMPRTTYRGAFGGGGGDGVPPSSSQLIGGSSSEDHMLAEQMASRLSTKSGRAIFASCQLSQTPASAVATAATDAGRGGGLDGGWTAGLDSEMIAHRAAALAEKKIWQILQEHTTTTTTSAP
jgi:Proteasome assembly chaperone 4